MRVEFGYNRPVMIPIQLRISGFLSYCEPVEIDFGGFDLACISGANGAGKSSLLDAITWSLFGQARKRDDSIVNLQSKAAEVALTFSYESQVYRVIRALPRGKTTALEFQIRDGQDWRPLTERTLRETQARIESVLRLDYDTFVNASFFLQGRADQFTQQTASKRKEVLGSILGLETWEVYRQRAAERRKSVEQERDGIDGRIAEIDGELAEEQTRRARLIELEAELERLRTVRKGQEAALEQAKKVAASLDQQRALLDKLASALERGRATLAERRGRLAVKEADHASYADLVNRAAEITAAHAAWLQARAEVERLDGVAAQFREHDEKRQPLLREIAAEQARLEQEQVSLSEQLSVISDQLSVVSGLEGQIEAARQKLADTETALAGREEQTARLQLAREEQAGLKSENEALRLQMNELKERIAKLQAAGGAACPLCGQSLTPEHRASTLEQLQGDGTRMGDRYRANQARQSELVAQITEGEQHLALSATVERERLEASSVLSQLAERLDAAQKAAVEWQSVGAPRLAQVEKSLAGQEYAAEARACLSALDQELEALGYAAAAHDAARQAELQARGIEEDFRRLDSAREALKPIDDEIADLRAQIVALETETAAQEQEVASATAALAAAEASAPGLDAAERALLDVQEQENILNQQVGAARQKVAVLDDLRTRKAGLATGREELLRVIARHKTLERAFGRDGVPALLIEQALPQIESRANDLLDRLSDGRMSIRFVTQAEYRDKKRDDLKETLDIQISDGAGLRDYELYSGGEAFRVNFAIRLALSEVLAQRKGARLQTLVIDEGFGSQDAQGRQRLIEAINLVRGDFAKVLVITHLEELKDAFPNRIEVEKGENGSVVRVV
jgi:exonuclease SbcC